MADQAHNQILNSPLGELYPAVSRVRLNNVDTKIRLSFERLPQDRERADDIALASCDRQPIEDACRVAAAISEERGARSEDAVYVIGPSERSACKIGLASDPLKRLAELQTGSPERLKVFALFWSMDRQAKLLESLALRVASDMGLRIRGEWVRLVPAEAAKLVAAVASGMGASFADSAMWMRNRHRLVEAKRNLREGRESQNVMYLGGRIIARYGDDLAISDKRRRALQS